jgi:hypothetical protein
MRDGALLVFGEFGQRSPRRQQKNGVVPKPMGPSSLEPDGANAATLGRRYNAAGPGQTQTASEVRPATPDRHVAQCIQELVDSLGVRWSIPCRMHARRATQRIDTEARVIGQRPFSRCLRKRQSLLLSVASKGGRVFKNLWHVGDFCLAYDCESVAYQQFELCQLARIGSCKNQASHLLAQHLFLQVSQLGQRNQRRINHGIKRLLLEVALLSGALHLDQPAALERHHIQINLCRGVFFVV